MKLYTHAIMHDDYPDFYDTPVHKLDFKVNIGYDTDESRWFLSRNDEEDVYVVNLTPEDEAALWEAWRNNETEVKINDSYFPKR